MDNKSRGYNQEKKKLLEDISQLEKENEKLRSELAAYKLVSTHLFESEKKFEQLFNNISDGVYYLKIEDGGLAGEFIEVNNTAYSRLGYTREEMLKLSPFDIDIHAKEDIVKLLNRIKNNKTLTFESVHVCKDGRHIPVEIKTHIMDIEEEKYTLSVCRDISERKQAEKAKIQAEKLNVVAQLAAGIAHEIRNPLTSLKGFVQLFRSDTFPNEEIISIMESELERINSISSEFLTLAKPYHIDFSPIDLQKLLKNVVNLVDADAQRQSISIQLNLAKEKIIVNGVSVELKKVFLNLVKNAMESMPNGGNIFITEEEIEGYVHISIQDQGIGMTDEQIRRLGEPFFTTKETGTGLGLMVTFKIISTHHGKITIKSKINEGTTFIVKLPVIGARCRIR